MSTRQSLTAQQLYIDELTDAHREALSVLREQLATEPDPLQRRRLAIAILKARPPAFAKSPAQPQPAAAPDVNSPPRRGGARGWGSRPCEAAAGPHDEPDDRPAATAPPTRTRNDAARGEPLHKPHDHSPEHQVPPHLQGSFARLEALEAALTPRAP